MIHATYDEPPSLAGKALAEAVHSPVFPLRSNSLDSARRAFRVSSLTSSVVFQCVMFECPRFPPLPPSIFSLWGFMDAERSK